MSEFGTAISIWQPIFAIFGRFILIWRIFSYLYGKYHPNKMSAPMNRIKEVLEEKGIKQTWLADKLGKSFSIVNAYACNRRQPSLEQLFEIAKILQVDPKDLISNK